MLFKGSTGFRIDFYRVLYVALPILAIALILVGVMSLSTLKSVDADRQMVTERYSRALAITNHLRYLQASIDATTLDFVLSGKPATREKISSLGAEFSDVAQKMILVVADSGTTARLLRIEDMRRSLAAQIAPVLQARADGLSTDQTRRRLEAVGKKSYLEVNQSLADMFAFQLERFGKIRTHTDSSIAHLTHEVMLVSVLALVVFILIGAVLLRLAKTQRALEKDREKILRQSQLISEARKEILETVAHDLKNPIGSIKMGLGLALESPADPVESVRDVLEISHRSTEAMERLVSDLLDHAKIESGQLQLKRERSDLRPFIESLVKRFALLASRKDIRLSSQYASRPFLVDIDPGRMDQLLSNILGNAIKFTPNGGRVDLSVGRKDGFVVIAVKDEGPGLEPAAIAHVFDRYWQVRQTAAQGTGLGLAIAKAIAEAHQGSVWVESRPGLGSTFYVALPLTADVTPSNGLFGLARPLLNQSGREEVLREQNRP